MTGEVLRLERRFTAPPADVFAAWTEPETLRRWWAAQAGWQGADASVDLRPGGRYSLSMHDPAAGATYTVEGEYVEVVAPERLAYTWTWRGEPAEMRGSEGTLVEVEFVPDGGGTRVVLTHSGFDGAHARDLHGEGWHGCLASLARIVPERREGRR